MSNTSTPEDANNQVTTHDAGWLKELEVQSWQAELVISGLIITGLFQMPDVFIKWVEPAIIESGEIEYNFLHFASIYFLIGIDCLVIFFGVHLLFRGIWVALLGLNSVYPGGIDVNSTNGMGAKYWQKAKEKYPDLTRYNLELDANCSLLFSLASVTIIIVTSISVFILILYQCIRLATSFFPEVANHAVAIGIGIYLVFMVITLTAQYLGKKYPDNQSIEKFINGFGALSSSFFSLYVFRKPIGYITSIYFSNVRSKYSGILIIIACMVMGYMSGRQSFQNSVIYDFKPDTYFTFNNRPHEIQPCNYESMLAEEALVYAPIIPSDVITDDYLKVFIPTIEREKDHIGAKEYTLKERYNMSTADRVRVDLEKLTAYTRFNQIFVNDIAYDSLEYRFYEHPKATERGLLVYVPTERFVKGRNILEIRKAYFSKDSVQKIVKIPFFFSSPE